MVRTEGEKVPDFMDVAGNDSMQAEEKYTEETANREAQAAIPPQIELDSVSTRDYARNAFWGRVVLLSLRVPAQLHA